MSSFPGSPVLLKGGIVLIDPTTAAIQRVITLQYNPDTLTRSLQAQSVDPGNKDRSEVMRLKGPAIGEEITLVGVYGDISRLPQEELAAYMRFAPSQPRLPIEQIELVLPALRDIAGTA